MTRTGFVVRRQAMTRAVARAVLALAAVLRSASGLGRRFIARIAASEQHTPLGHRERQTNLRAKTAGKGKQLTFMWAEGQPVEVQAPSEVPLEVESSPSGVTAYKRGYQSPDAQIAAHELHFDQSNARAIHGAISSASRHAQGKRDHRGM